jgi:hypothetical protein
VAIQGLDQAPAFPAAVDCFLPATGIARDASLSQDGQTIAWKDGDGVKTAGTPSTSADPCVLTRAPALISATGTHPSIGGADVGAFIPKSPITTPPAPGPGAPTGAAPSRPVVTLPATLTANALASARGVPVKVKVNGPGKVTVTATVAARRLGRHGKPVVVARGTATPAAAGTVTIRLKFTATARKRARTLRGARLTLRIVHRSGSVTKTLSVR